MKKIHTLIAFVLFISTSLFAQYSTDWVRPADNIAKNGAMIARDNQDNLLVTGYVDNQGIYTRKYNKFGVLLWEKNSVSGVASTYEKSVWINTDSRNNVFVVGHRYLGAYGLSSDAIVVLKYSASGTLLWKKNIPFFFRGSSQNGRVNLRSEVDNSGNLYIGTAATDPGGFALYKLNAAGTLVFTRNSIVNAPRNFSSMRLKGNRIVMTGGAGTRTRAPFIVWDTAGTLLFTQVVTGTGGADVEMDAEGNTYLLSSFTNQVTATSGQDIVICKFNPTGTQLWRKSYHFGGIEFPNRFVLAADKLSVIGSINVSDWVTFQVDATGTQRWNARYNATNNEELPAFIAAKDNGEVFVTGKGGPDVSSVNGSTYLRMITLKYSNTGTVKWIDSVNIYAGFGLACTLATDGSLYALGHANMTVCHFIDHNGTGSCGMPGGITASNVATTTASITWPPVTGATLYHVRYKTAAATTWTVVSTNTASYLLTGLSAGTTYSYSVEAVCSSGPSGYSAAQTFATLGAGYCSTGGQSQVQEYLSLVWLGGIMNSTGRDNGYGDYTNLSGTITRGQNVSGYLSGLVPYPEYENYSIWIDFNHDNDFTDPGEQVFNISSDFSGFIQVNFVIPAGVPEGQTRMRITMCYGTVPTPCGVYARGETEDYTVNITSMLTGQRPQPATTAVVPEKTVAGIYPNPASDVLYLKGFAINNPDQYIEIYDMAGRKILVSSNPGNNVNVSTLKPGAYVIRIIQNKTGVYTGQFIKK